MTRIRSLIAALALCAGALHAHSAGAVTIQSNLGSSAAPSNLGVTNAQWLAAKVTLPATAYNITSVTAQMRANNTSRPLQVRVCNDNGSGTAPGTTCSVFTGTNPATGSFVNYTFTGSFAASASQVIWVVASVPIAGGTYVWTLANSSPGNDNDVSSSHNQGTSWATASASVTLAIDGSAVLAAPTLDTWARISLALSLAAGGAWMVRRRARV